MTFRLLSRRGLTMLAATLTVTPVLLAAAVTADTSPGGRARLAEAHEANVSEAEAMRCPDDLVIKGTLPGQPDGCAHVDIAPPGVDINKPVSTAVLETREGAAPAAVEAAEDLGIPASAEVAAVTDRVVCDGDGTSGYRTQAIYAVTADRPNRYADVQDDIKTWAAGMNTVFNLSAAKTGGIRDIRFVTETNGDGTCSPKVLNVTLPVGSGASFSHTIGALQQAGFVSGARKYSVWFDGTGQCGIALTYLSSQDGQGNPNNGSYPQYARTDTACWGSSQSVEAHELSHTMGSVQGDAPHATSNGHCFDESDRMCYADGGGKAMQYICAGDQEVLFDCNDDDYYSTYPQAGSYLDTHWNTADSRFLIGGGDGTGGGTAGLPTRLGGTLGLNNPATAGLPTQVAINLEIPAGRTITSTRWTSTRLDCVFTDPAATQTNLTCDAKSTTSAPVTVTVSDNTGDRVVRSGTVTFATAAARTATATLGVDGRTAATYVACPTGKGILSATVVDQASGVPVKGITVDWFRTVGTAAPVKLASAVTGSDGTAASTAKLVLAGTYTTRTVATGGFGAVSSPGTTVTVASGTCATTLTSSLDATTVKAGTPVRVSGRLTRTLPSGGTALPAAGELVKISLKPTGSTTSTVLATTPTLADGSYTVPVTLLASGQVQATMAAHTGFAASAALAVPVTVSPQATAVTLNASTTSTMAGNAVTLTGTLTQSDGTTATGMAATTLSVVYPVAGGKTATVSARTSATGTYSLVVRPTGSGPVTVKYAGKPGWPAATATTSLTIREWVTAVSATTSAAEVMAGNPVTVAGTLTQSDGSASTGLISVPVSITYPIAGGRTATTSTTTKTGGAYSLAIRPMGSGNVVVRYAGKAGWAASTTTRPVTVRDWTSTLTSSATRDPATGLVVVTGLLRATDMNGTSTPKAGARIAITYQLSATSTAVASATTTATGQYTVTVKPGATGSVVARYAGVPGWGAAAAAPVTITVAPLSTTRASDTGTGTQTGAQTGTPSSTEEAERSGKKAKASQRTKGTKGKKGKKGKKVRTPARRG